MRQMIVVPYNPAWPQMFETEALRIKHALGDNCITVHHIGSTAVPELSAKPIIDILPVVKDIAAIRSDALEYLGYVARGEMGMPFRRYFYKGDGAERSHHIHIWPEGLAEIQRHLMFRDYLRAYPEERQRYEKLKIALSQQYREDRHAYTTGKESLIWDMLDKAGFDDYVMVEVASSSEQAAFERMIGLQSEIGQSLILRKGSTIVAAAIVDGNIISACQAISGSHANVFQAMLRRWIESF